MAWICMANTASRRAMTKGMKPGWRKTLRRWGFRCKMIFFRGTGEVPMIAVADWLRQAGRATGRARCAASAEEGRDGRLTRYSAPAYRTFKKNTLLSWRYDDFSLAFSLMLPIMLPGVL